MTCNMSAQISDFRERSLITLDFWMCKRVFSALNGFGISNLLVNYPVQEGGYIMPIRQGLRRNFATWEATAIVFLCDRTLL